MIKEKWFIHNKKGEFGKISSELGINSVIERLLINRGFNTVSKAKAFLDNSTEGFHDPFLMRDMDRAAGILADAVAEQAKMLIVGDYDVDGIMGIYIFLKAIMGCDSGADINFLIPNRVSDGYGINDNIIEKAYNEGVNLIITCDNGISAFDAVQTAKNFGITIIITDHHEIQMQTAEDGSQTQILPGADAVLNPKQADCNYPYKKLCGTAVAFKLAQALYMELGLPNAQLDDLMQFIALATICDVCDLDGENRLFVSYGLELLNRTKNIGLSALINLTGLNRRKIETYAAGFVLGPCFNATGRLESAELSVMLLLCNTDDEALPIAKRLYDLNKERQSMTEDGMIKALAEIEANNISVDGVIVLYLEDIHESIAGIIAGRIRDMYYAPTIVLTKGFNDIKGSGRSIEGYDMAAALYQCADLLLKYGGHPMAAGLTLKGENVDEFRKAINKQYNRPENHGNRTVMIDMILPFEMTTSGMVREISIIEPCGKGNPRPLFGVKNIIFSGARRVGKNGNVLKLKLTSDNAVREGVILGENNISKFIDYVKNHSGDVGLKRLKDSSGGLKGDLTYRIENNTYNGKQYLNIYIDSYRFS